jgi:hypothetical protein
LPFIKDKREELDASIMGGLMIEDEEDDSRTPPNFNGIIPNCAKENFSGFRKRLKRWLNV